MLGRCRLLFFVLLFASSAWGKNAYVTLVTAGDDYVFGAEVLAKALRATGSVAPLVCLVSTNLMPPSLSPSRKQTKKLEAVRKEQLDRLRLAGYAIRFVNSITNPNNNLERQWFQTTYTKLHIFNLTQFEQIVYLDTDTLVLSNLDHLFQQPIQHIAAVPDILPPDKMQSGVLVIRPSTRLFEDMLRAVEMDRAQIEQGTEPRLFESYDGGDQGFLNAFFSKWYTLDAAHRLPFEYNTLASVASLYPPAFNFLHNRRTIRIMHFSGDPDKKPWYTGQRVLTGSMAPYLFIWTRMARQVKAQFAAHKQFESDSLYLQRFHEAHPIGNFSSAIPPDAIPSAHMRLVFADGSQIFPHPWSSFPAILEHQPAFQQFSGNLKDKDSLLAEKDPRVMQAWFESPAVPPTGRVDEL